MDNSLFNLSIGFISFLTSAVVFLALLLIYLIGLKKISSGKLFLLLISATLIWSIMLTLSQIGSSIPFNLVVVAELLRYFTWFYILQQVTGHYRQQPFRFNLQNPLSPLIIFTLFLTSILTLMLNDQLVSSLRLNNPNIIQIGWMMIFSILGLVLVEHLYRNTSVENRAKVYYLCISAGAIFAYDFFVFTDALLIQSIDYQYWSARGIVNVLIVPPLMLAAVKNPTLAPTLHVSRKFVFHSTTLMGSGLYLILMSGAGYYIKQKSGDWGTLLQATFLFAALLLFASLFFSATLKTRIERYLSRSFSNKYDYRDEWNRFSNTLLSHDSGLSIFKRSLQAVGQIVDGQGASLWLKDNKFYRCHTGWKMSVDNFNPESKNSKFIQFLRHNHNLFTLDDYKKKNNTIDTDHWFLTTPYSWMILPLWINDRLFGFIHLQESVAPLALDMEDSDLLNTIAHHIALSLSLNESYSALQEAERFNQISHMTAFLVHDLKTLLSQLSLLVENGKIHRDNPSFINDMLNTLDHVTKKMQRLIQQLKNPEIKDDTLFCGITTVIKSIVDDYPQHPKKIHFINGLKDEIFITARQEELDSAIRHIVQNAVESVGKLGKVKIELGLINVKKIFITITDNGKGMSREFISERLFKPFDSTKGVSGMGIGMFQSREYIRSIDGEMFITSNPGVGTTFTLHLPLKHG